MEVDWSAITIDLLAIIGSKLDLAADRLRFRSVSKSWRRSVALPFPRPPWLVLSEPNPAKKHYAVEFSEIKNISVPLLPRGFVGLTEQKIYEFDLPEAHERQIIGSTGTLLITIGEDGLVHLLNPFTRIQIQLPSVTTFSDYDSKHHTKGRQRRDHIAEKIILSSSSSTKDCIAMAIHAKGQLSFARPGDLSWTRCSTPENWIKDLVFYKENFYAVNCYGIVMVCDISTCQSSIVMPEFQLQKFDRGRVNFYLVEWMGDLLMVIKLTDAVECFNYMRLYHNQRRRLERMKRTEETVLYRTKGFKIYKLDLCNSKWDELKNLGEYSLFLGRNTSISLLASDHGGIKKNCIYFTDDCTNVARFGNMSCGRDMGVFDMEKNDIHPHYKGTSTSLYSPPLWLIPHSLANRN